MHGSEANLVLIERYSMVLMQRMHAPCSVINYCDISAAG